MTTSSTYYGYMVLVSHFLYMAPIFLHSFVISSNSNFLPVN